MDKDANRGGASRLSGELLEGIEPQAARRLEASCSWRVARAGEEIVNRSSASRDLFFVVKGKVRVVNYSISGREIAYATVEPGGWFGELAAIDGLPRSATVVALEDTTLGVLGPEAFRDFLMSNGRAAMAVIRKLARIVRTCDERIMDLATLSAYQRVYRALISLMRADPVRPESWLIYPMPTQSVIAADASTTRETVARVLSQLAQGGIVERKAKTLYIRRVDDLHTLAERAAPEAAGAQ